MLVQYAQGATTVAGCEAVIGDVDLLVLVVHGDRERYIPDVTRGEHGAAAAVQHIQRAVVGRDILILVDVVVVRREDTTPRLIHGQRRRPSVGSGRGRDGAACRVQNAHVAGARPVPSDGDATPAFVHRHNVDRRRLDGTVLKRRGEFDDTPNCSAGAVYHDQLCRAVAGVADEHAPGALGHGDWAGVAADGYR